MLFKNLKILEKHFKFVDFKIRFKRYVKNYFIMLTRNSNYAEFSPNY